MGYEWYSLVITGYIQPAISFLNVSKELVCESFYADIVCTVLEYGDSGRNQQYPTRCV